MNLVPGNLAVLKPLSVDVDQIRTKFGRSRAKRGRWNSGSNSPSSAHNWSRSIQSRPILRQFWSIPGKLRIRAKSGDSGPNLAEVLVPESVEIGPKLVASGRNRPMLGPMSCPELGHTWPSTEFTISAKFDTDSAAFEIRPHLGEFGWIWPDLGRHWPAFQEVAQHWCRNAKSLSNVA